MKMHLPIAVFTAFLLMIDFARAEPDDIFMIRTTSKTPDALVAAVKSYTEEQKWRFISEGEAKQGEVTLVKICIPEVGKLVWQAGLRASALLPCGTWESTRMEQPRRFPFYIRATCTCSIPTPLLSRLAPSLSGSFSKCLMRSPSRAIPSAGR